QIYTCLSFSFPSIAASQRSCQADLYPSNVTGPLLPSNIDLECCGAAHRRRHSCIAQHFLGQNVGLRTFPPFAAGASFTASKSSTDNKGGKRTFAAVCIEVRSAAISCQLPKFSYRQLSTDRRLLPSHNMSGSIFTKKDRQSSHQQADLWGIFPFTSVYVSTLQNMVIL
ncbi:MAG: hypothetical protein QMC33_03745, partial [Octadecabacter sp.]